MSQALLYMFQNKQKSASKFITLRRTKIKLHSCWLSIPAAVMKCHWPGSLLTTGISFSRFQRGPRSRRGYGRVRALFLVHSVCLSPPPPPAPEFTRWKRQGSLSIRSMGSPEKALTPFTWAAPSRPQHLQRPHILMSSHWAVGIQHKNLGRWAQETFSPGHLPFNPFVNWCSRAMFMEIRCFPRLGDSNET